MKGPIRPDQIDQVIHERVRLSIVSTLAVVPEMSFGDLKSTLSLTDGNLSAHSRVLEEAKYIEISKTFKGRRPHTTMRLTKKGRQAFKKYLAALQHVLGDWEENDS